MTKHNLTLCIYTHCKYHRGVQLPIAAHDHRDQFLKGSPGSCPWPKTKEKSLKVLMQPRGIGKDALLLPILSLNCSCTLQSRDWGMNPGPGSFNKVIKSFQDWLGKLHLKSPTTHAQPPHCLLRGGLLSLTSPLFWKKVFTSSQRTWRGFIRQIWRGNAVYCLAALSDLGKLFFIRSVSH